MTRLAVFSCFGLFLSGRWACHQTKGHKRQMQCLQAQKIVIKAHPWWKKKIAVGAFANIFTLLVRNCAISQEKGGWISPTSTSPAGSALRPSP